MEEAFRDFIKENLKITVSTDFNECTGDTVTVELLLKDKEGNFEVISRQSDYLN